MKANQEQKSRISTNKSTIKIAKYSIDSIDENPVQKRIREAGLDGQIDDRKLQVEHYLSTRQKRRWDRMPESQKQRIYKRAMRSRSYRNLDDAIKNKIAISDQEKKIEERKAKTEANNESLQQLKSGSSNGKTFGNSAGKSTEKTAEQATEKTIKTGAKASGEIGERAATDSATAGTAEVAHIAKDAMKVAKKIGDAAAKDMSKGLPQSQFCSQDNTDEHPKVMTGPIGFIGKIAMFVAGAAQAAFLPMMLPMLIVIVALTVVVTPVISVVSWLSSTVEKLDKATASFIAWVEKDRPTVSAFLKENELEDYTDVVLAIIQYESKSDENAADLMNVTKYPTGDASLQKDISENGYLYAGCKRFSILFSEGQESGVDIKTIIQSYEYGPDFITYIAENYDGQYSVAASQKFKDILSNDADVKAKGYTIGAPDFANQIYKIMYGDGMNQDTWAALESVFLQYKGFKYTWGGTNPTTSFDCSGLTSYCYKQIGINLPRTAQEQYDKSTHITADEAVPGDLIFFTGTYSTTAAVTHVGIYCGTGKMFDAGDPIDYSDITTKYWQKHFYGFGRVITAKKVESPEKNHTNNNKQNNNNHGGGMIEMEQ